MASEWMRRGRAAVVLGGMIGALGGASALSAQERGPVAPRPPARPEGEGVRECRCTDESGQRRERCFCFVMPEMAMGWLPGLARRVVLGVNVRQDQPTRDDEQGVRLYGVDESSGAGEAGLEEGDVLVRVAGQSLVEPLADRRAEERLAQERSRPVQRLLAVLGERDAGDTLRVEYLRDGERKSATVVLQDASVPPMRMGMFDSNAPDAPMTLAGIELLEMRAGLAQYFGAGEGGVLVSDAGADNPLGLRAGDVLLAVDGREVRGVDQALRVLRSYEDDEPVRLRVLRRQETLELTGRIR